MTFREAVRNFANFYGPYKDYWSMQQEWEFYKDSLCRCGSITIKQYNKWSNPCTPETFKDFNHKWYGLVNR